MVDLSLEKSFPKWHSSIDGGHRHFYNRLETGGGWLEEVEDV